MSNPFSLQSIEAKRVAPPEETGVAPISPANDNPFSLSAIESSRQRAAETQVDTRATLNAAVRQNPDQAARAAQLSQQRNIPVDVVARNLQDVELQAIVDKHDETLRTSPRLAKALRERHWLAQQAHDDIETEAQIERTLMGTVGDLGVTALKGAIGLPQSFVGLMNLVSGGEVGLGVESAGIRFGDAQKFLDTLYSPAQQRANMAVREAEGFLGTLGAMLENPSTIGLTVLESTPQMLGGAALGRGLTMAAPRLAPWLAATFGEGLMGAGAMAEQFRQESDTGVINAKQTLASLGGGAGTALFGAGGAKLAQALRVADIDTVLTSRGMTAAAATDLRRGFATAIAKAGISEGVFEELPQSVQEQIWQNWANDRPLGENVGKSAAQGLLAGLAMGSGFQAIGEVTARIAETEIEKERRLQDTRVEAERLQSLFALASQSKLRERNPETFGELVAEMSDNAQVYLDAEVLNQLPREVVAQLTGVDTQIADAPGGDTPIAVNVADLMKVLPGTGLEQMITENVRKEPDSMTMSEVLQSEAQAETFIRGEAERILQQVNDRASWEAEVDTVRKNILEQLNVAGRTRPESNASYAELQAAFFSTMASRYGMTPTQLFSEFNLAISNRRGGNATAQELLNAPRTGEVTVEAYHYSPQDLSFVSTAMFGRGLKGSGREQYQTAADPRLRQRSYFYVDKGTGINPEAGVGGRAHRAVLSSIYDSNADPLRLKQGRDQLGFESAVLDAGFIGYLDRLEGTQSGQVIVLGGQNIAVEPLGALSRTQGRPVPPPQRTPPQGRDRITEAINGMRDLPAGQLTLQRWSEILQRRMPEMQAELAAAGVFEGEGTFYRDGLVRRINEMTEAPVYEQRRPKEVKKANPPVPPSVAAVANVESAFQLAGSRQFNTNRELKLELQARVQEALRRARVDLTNFDEATVEYLTQMVLTDARVALQTNPNAVGWYNEKVTKALRVVSLIHPEINTDRQAKFAFVWGLAVTSNGLKVDKNFELAEKAYQGYKATGRMPLNIGVGTAAGKINEGLKAFNVLMDKHGFENLERFMTTKTSVREVEAFGVKVSGEGKDTQVYGAAILGPKIGNGFFANLYGRFEQLTMDRWLMRTWGRWTGTLVEFRPEEVKQKSRQLVELIKRLSPADKRAYERIIGAKLNLRNPTQTAEAIWAASTKKENRDLMNAIGVGNLDTITEIMGEARANVERVGLGDEIRKVGNNLTKLVDGQKESPAGSTERNGIRQVFQAALEQLQQEFPKLTMSDLQALLWYPEKRLYDAAKTTDDVETGYEDDAAPDYANAAVALARAQGVDQAAIDAAIKEVDDALLAADSSTGAGAGTGDSTATDGATAGGGEGIPQSGRFAPLEGAPRVEGASGPDPRLVAVAEQYARANGIELRRQGTFVEVDPERAARIAAAYEAMPHAPNDPAVQAAYADLIAQTRAQYEALFDAGYRFTFFDDSSDPYNGNPWNAMRDLRANQTMAVYGTYAGYGTEGITAEARADNPMLADTGLRWPDQNGVMRPVVANDLFRAVHDAFGHGLEGAGFRARGEENAWQAHVRLFTGPAVAAITSETRGQNSWLNYGPYGERNRNAGVQDTVFAEQKTGLMPEWTWTEGRADDAPINPNAATLDDFTPDRIGDILTKEDWSILTAEDPGATKASPEQNGQRMAELKRDLDAIGAQYLDVIGKYGDVQNSLIVVGITSEQALAIGKKYGQESVLTREGLVYPDGRPTVPATGVSVFDQAPSDLYTAIPQTGVFFSADLAFDQPLNQMNMGVNPPLPQTETPEFQAWFGDSKVVDAEGGPLVVYHGTVASFDAFDPSAEPYSYESDRGKQFFLDNPQGASDYAIGTSDAYGGNANVMPVYLRMQNPRIVDVDGSPSEWWDSQPERMWALDVERRGHDGLIVRGDGETMYVTADPTQIKSAIGNDGSFDIDDPRILSQGPLGTFDPARMELVLNENANLSTFLHESGHFFLEVMVDLASRPGAPEQVKSDVDALMKWFGVPDLQTWQGYTLDQKRPHHERFAESFEQYLFEGKAPSSELQSTFRTFRSWLINVYRSLVDFVRGRGLNLSDEVRSVFDRMLATDAQIAEAERVAGLLPDPDATGEAQERLQKRSLANMKWAANARSKYIKELQAQAKDLRKAVQEEVTEEVNAMPEFQAAETLDAMRKATPEYKAALKTWEAARDAAREQARTEIQGNLLATEGAGLKGLEKGQFLAKNKRSIDNQADAAVIAWEKQNPRPKKEVVGSDLDMATTAATFGFDSVDAMLKAIDAMGNKKDLIEQMTDQRMLERHGDLVDQRAIEEAANEAVHNELRARMLAAELKAETETLGAREQVGTARNGRAITVNALANAAKQFGQNIVSRTRIRSLGAEANKHRAAQARAATRWQEAGRSGDTRARVQAKRDQVLNNAATKALLEAKAATDKSVEYLRKFDKDSVRTSLPPEYIEQIDALLERMDLRRSTTGTQIDRRTSLLAFVERQQEAGLPINIPDEVLQDAGMTSYKELTVEEFNGLVDAVKNIEHLGRLKKKLLTLKDAREFAEVEQQIADMIVENGGKAKPVPLEEERGIIPWLKGFWASHRKMSSLARQMSGGQDGGPLWDALIRPMNERGAYEETEIEKATMKLAEIYQPLLDLPGGLDGDSQFIPEIGASLTRGGRLSILLNWGNPANRQRIMDGDGWTQDQVNAIFAKITPAEARFANQIWEYLDSFWPEVKAKQQRVSGVVEDKVEASPFTLRIDGQDVPMRGGYYPLKYDLNRSDRAESLEAAEVAKDMMRGAFTAATTRRGHTKARQQSVSMPVRKDLSVITQHITEVVHDLAWHEWIIDANRLLRSKKITDAIRTYYGVETLRTMRDALTGIATSDIVPQTKIDRALTILRANISRSTMGISFTTAMLQPFGLTQSMVRIGAANVLRGVARWGGDMARFENSMSWITEKSEFMRMRNKTFNRELREINQRIQGKSKTMIAIDGGLFWLMQKMQLVADVPTWIGAYEAAIRQGLDDATAVQRADSAVLEAQGGGQIKDLAEVQRKHPMLTQFYSYFSVTLNLMAERTGTTDFKNPRAVAGWLGDMALLLVIPAIAPALVIDLLRGGGDEDDPEEWAKKLAQWQVGYLLGMVVGARELSGAISGFDYAGPPVGRIVADTGKVGQQVAQGEIDEPAVLAFIRWAGSAFGIPTVQMIRSYKGWVAWEEGDAPASAILMGPPPKD